MQFGYVMWLISEVKVLTKRLWIGGTVVGLRR